ncbi:MAG TPA: IS30 family transposase, partial [Lentzea sp.]
MSSREACRVVGINYRTGKRWRNGKNQSRWNNAAPPITEVPAPLVRGRFLNEDERIVIADRRRAGASTRQIAT